MREIVLRDATEKDIEDMVFMEQKCFSDPWSWEMLYEDVVDNDISTYILAEERGKLLGYIGMWSVLGECQINNVAVDPEKRQEGIGSLLLGAVIRSTEESGVTYWILEVREGNEAAIALYKKFGFEVVGSRPNYYDDGETALLMSRGEPL